MRCSSSTYTESAQEARASVSDPSWCLPGDVFLTRSNQVEASQKTQDTLEGLCLSAVLETPSGLAGLARRDYWDQGSLDMNGIILSLITMIIMKQEKKNQNNNKRKQKKQQQQFVCALFAAALKENTEREYAFDFQGACRWPLADGFS